MSRPAVTADTSVVIAALSRWHEAHRTVLGVIADVQWVPVHVALETVSAMTRMPRGLAVSAETVLAALRSRFPKPAIVLSSDRRDQLCASIVEHDLRGGQVYDALVAATAAQQGATLLSRDRRALPAYRAVGVDIRFIGGAT